VNFFMLGVSLVGWFVFDGSAFDGSPPEEPLVEALLL
jgi:hypothetical protein